jgi:hypothetical protein
MTGVKAMSETAETACVFPTRPGVAGHVAACQLCPASPTYWRGGPTTDVCRYDKPAEKPEEGADR